MFYFAFKRAVHLTNQPAVTKGKEREQNSEATGSHRGINWGRLSVELNIFNKLLLFKIISIVFLYCEKLSQTFGLFRQFGKFFLDFFNKTIINNCC